VVLLFLKVGVNMTSSSPYISYREPMRVERNITRQFVYVFIKHLHVIRHLRR
jgi:hypothetical protein